MNQSFTPQGEPWRPTRYAVVFPDTSKGAHEPESFVDQYYGSAHTMRAIWYCFGNPDALGYRRVYTRSPQRARGVLPALRFLRRTLTWLDRLDGERQRSWFRIVRLNPSEGQRYS